MPQQPTPAIVNNLSAGLKTEYTGLNFPENACTDTLNCIFNRTGNVIRRPGFDYEDMHSSTTISHTNSAVSTYVWKNAGGDGNTVVVVTQIANNLFFYVASSATTSSPLSTQRLATMVDVSSFVAQGGSYDFASECQFSDGNGYLFVFHPSCDPFYCTYVVGAPPTITSNRITIQIRDFAGIPEPGVPYDFRPPSPLTFEHQYNLQNQGWWTAVAWSASSTSTNDSNTGNHTWTVQAGLTIGGGDLVGITGSLDGSTGKYTVNGFGNVVSYAGTTLVINVQSMSAPGLIMTVWSFEHAGISSYNLYATATGRFPSNGDVWFRYKDPNNAFSVTGLGPFSSATINSVKDIVERNIAPAPKGHYILNAFSQSRNIAATLSTLTDITTTARPKTGCWFQGRIWFSGVDASFPRTGDAPFTTWTESIYFSQIVETTDQFGYCYQVNDPTSETAFDLLPSDGGVVVIQGSGSIYKLFPVQNGLVVFAANGIWFITGSQGIGFTANDYTITRISSVQTISGSSFVDVQGLPFWWNAEGIYAMQLQNQATPYGPSRGAVGGNTGLQTEPITVTTIQTFYDNIPQSSKKYAKGSFDPINWLVRWIYKTAEEQSVTDRYQYDGILTFNLITQAFYPWKVANLDSGVFMLAINFVQSPGGLLSPDPVFKYLTTTPVNSVTFSETRNDTDFKDWLGEDYSSYFVAGYNLKGVAQRRFQTNYVYIYTNNTVESSYKLQGIWDYGTHGDSGKFSTVSLALNSTFFGVIPRRYRVRGRGLAFQLKITSTTGAPFDIIGWSMQDMVNAGV